MPAPRLSLCLIAKDEAAFLPGLLASVRGQVDEIILTDTGSADDTVAIARAAGARVVHHPWQGDFAAARNAALAPATGDWILLLDADERLAQDAGPALRAALLGDLDCGLLPLHHAASLEAPEAAVRLGAARLGEPAFLPRLLRRSADLRWEGRVHESVSAWLPGKRVGRVDAHILHLGRVPAVVAARDKSARNIGLLQRRVQEEPDEPTIFHHLAAELFAVGRSAEAAAAVEQGWAVLLRVVNRPGLRPQVAPLAGLRVKLQLHHEELDGAEQTLAFARAWSGPHPNLDHAEGELARRRGDARRAAAAYARARAADGQLQATETFPGVTSALALAGLASALLSLGQPAAALDAARGALALPKPPLEARLSEVEALFRLGQLPAARARFAPLLAAAQRSALLADFVALARLLDLPVGALPVARWVDPLRAHRLPL